MEIHKPKPWHGIREFLKEYVIIVVGVVTALVGEAGVEALHWRHAVRDAREAMAPVEKDLVEFAAEREAQSPCLAAQFRQLRAALDEAGQTGWLPAIGSVRNPVRRSWTFNTYDAIVSGQVLPHVSTHELGVLVSLNGWSQYLQRNRDIEVRDWSVLRGVEGPRRRAGEAELANLRASLSEAIYEAGLVRGGAHALTERIIRQGLLTPAEIDKAWADGDKKGRGGPYGACPNRPASDTDQLLQQLDTPLNTPRWDTAHFPAGWPRGAN